MCEPTTFKGIKNNRTFKRSPNFSNREKNSVIELVMKYNNLINNKTKSIKNEAWSQIVEEFNCRTDHTEICRITSTNLNFTLSLSKRTREQIEKFLQNSKSKINENLSCANRKATGGASPLYEMKSSTIDEETTDISCINDNDMNDKEDLIAYSDDLSNELEKNVPSVLSESAVEFLTSTREQVEPYKSQHPDDIKMKGDLSYPQNEITETVTDASRTESVCNQQGKVGKEREVQPVDKLEPLIEKSGDSKNELYKENAKDRAKLPSAVLTKQPEEECQIYTFFKSMAMFVKKMDLEFQMYAIQQISEFICKLKLDQNGIQRGGTDIICSSSSLDSANSYSVPHDHLQQSTSVPDNEMSFRADMSGPPE